jgi:ATP-dependent Clp protease ATP-binding subunit ClpA
MFISEQVRRVCQLAAEEARATGAAQVGTEHVLLALLGVEGVAATFLGELGVELSCVRRAVAELLYPSPDGPPGTPALSLPAAWLFGAVFWEAFRSDRDIDTQQVLLGLLRQPDTVAGHVLRGLGLVPETLAEQLQTRLAGRDLATFPPPESHASFHRAESRDSLTARLSGAARRVVQRAEEECLRRRQDYIGSEHILLSLFHEGASRGRQVLARLGVELEGVRRDVERFILPSRCPPVRGPLPLTARAGLALKRSRVEAGRLGHERVSTDHLLLGLARDEESLAGQILRQHGVPLDTIREQVGDLRASNVPGLDDD